MPEITSRAALPTTPTISTLPPKEAAPAEVVAPPAEEKRELLSPQHAALAKKERALRAEAQRIKAEADKMKSDNEARDNEYKTNYIPKERLTKETLSVLAELGISNDQLAQLLLNPERAAQDQAYSKLKAEMDQQIQDLKKSQETAQKTQYEQAVKQLDTQVKALVEKNPDQYEAIKTMGYESAVTKFIEKEFQDTGVVPTVEEAAQFVEEYLVEEALKPTSLKKVQEKLKAQEAASQAASKETVLSKPQASQGIKTLTNAVQASSRPMSARERAIHAFNQAKEQRLAK